MRQRPPPIETVLFDLDGTLVDSVELILAAYRHAFAVHRGAPLPDALWLRGIGTPLATQIRDLAHDEDEASLLLETYRRFAIASHDQLIRRFEGMDGVVEALAGAGLGLGIVSSKRRVGVERGLRTCGLDGYFAVLVGSDDVTVHKPDPAPVHHAMDQLGAEPETTVFIGDSVHDMEAGRAAGVRTVAALWGPFEREVLAPAEPDHWCASPEDLLDLLLRSP